MRKEDFYSLNLSLGEWFAVGKNLVNAGLVHTRVSRRLSQEGIPWYPTGSFLLPIMSDLTGRNISNTMLPLITHLNHYMRQTDDFFDEREGFPSWAECKNGVRQTQSVLLNDISKLDIDSAKKRMIFHEIAGLRRGAYVALQEQAMWEQDPTFEVVYAHRLNTTGRFARTVAEIWSILTDIPEEKRVEARDALQRIGMTFQYVDDLMDLRDDLPVDGNLVHAILNENMKERQGVNQALASARGNPRVLDLLMRFAPESTDRLLRRIDEETTPIKDISPSLEQTIRGGVKLVLPRIIISNGSFYRKIAVW